MKISFDRNRTNLNKSQNSAMNSLSERKELSFDNIYDVFGIGVYDELTQFLIDPFDDCRPTWYSASMFSIIDNQFMGYIDNNEHLKSNGWLIILSYKEMFEVPNHLNGLIEREDFHLEIFRKVKSRMRSELR